MKRLSLMAVVLAVAFAPTFAFAQTATLTPSGAPSPAMQHDLEHTVAYVQPSIVYLDIVATAWVWDTTNKAYLNDGDPSPSMRRVPASS